MENTNRIYHSPAYAQYLKQLERLEANRVFCHHDLAHFLSVGRIAYILSLEQGLSVSKDLLYTAALLHDLGRVDQYEKGIPHDEASVEIAKEFLKLCDFSYEEKQRILRLIGGHRHMSDDPLEALFYQADKLSRPCFFCPAQQDCHWPEERKNITLRY